MQTLIQFFVLLPLLGFIITIFLPKNKENLISKLSIYTIGIHFISFAIFVGYWLFNGHSTIDFKNIVIFKSEDYEFFIDFCFDKITVVYMMVGSFLSFLVIIYCSYYLHREEGYKRFFNIIMFFYLGYNITIFSGNLETLFVGWEILGISSFLLIAFYRDRYLPVKNAFKVFSIYRLGDVGLILAMWACHHLFHQNITFFQLQHDLLVNHHLENHSFIGIFVAIMILVTAAAKSAQLPFSSWLPRAMEGPTPSSAIFYGSLSVHLGVFLMLRTFELWENQISVRIIIGLLGLTTSFMATGIARVQSSIKAQIAYSSISQIGLIFIELACGLEILALIHFAGNAFLRTYQLLVSPSTVSYLIREQFYNFVPRPKSIEDSFSKKIKYSFYILSLKEFNLDTLVYRMWRPLKVMGRSLNFVTAKNVLYYFIPAYVIGIVLLVNENSIPEQLHHFLPTLFSFIGFVMVLKSYTERKNVYLAWSLIIMNHFWIALAISFNEQYIYTQSLLYLSGIVVMGAIGYLTIRKLKSTERHVDLNTFNGHSYEHPKFAFIFLLACLGLTGFPITPTFIGEDIIFTHIHEDQIALAFFTASSLIIDGISVIRIYARVFLGPHVKTNHASAYKSS
ncbi:MAG: proton-conducting transporter membrane subunit [Bacteroidota bacterium]|nr:proton-conducting transporter membrane subunit [Bacteroidota bacterium]